MAIGKDSPTHHVSGIGIDVIEFIHHGIPNEFGLNLVDVPTVKDLFDQVFGEQPWRSDFQWNKEFRDIGQAGILINHNWNVPCCFAHFLSGWLPAGNCKSNKPIPEKQISITMQILDVAQAGARQLKCGSAFLVGYLLQGQIILPTHKSLVLWLLPRL